MRIWPNGKPINIGAPVGAGGQGRLLTEQLSSFDYRGVVTTLICFLALTFLVDLMSASVRRTIC